MGIADNMLKAAAAEAARKSAESAAHHFADVGIKGMVPMMEKMRVNIVNAMKSPSFAKVPPEIKKQLKHELAELGKLASQVPGAHGGKRHKRKTLKKKHRKGRKKTHKKH